jgi:hyaluronoglucosaminidase
MKRLLSFFYALILGITISGLAFGPLPVMSATSFQNIQFRRGTAAGWADNNPVLLQGEPGFETDTGYVKIGDGLSHWNDLVYLNSIATDNGITPNADSIRFAQDNSIAVGNSNLYGLSLGVIPAWKYIYFNAAGALVAAPFGAVGTCWISNGITGAPTWGPCGTGGGVGWDNSADHWSTNAVFALTSTAYMKIGCDNTDDLVCWQMGYTKSLKKLEFNTQNFNGYNDNKPMFGIRVNSSGGTLETGQTVFSVIDWLTDLFKVTQGGNAAIPGEMVAGQFSTTCTASDNNCSVNIDAEDDGTCTAEGEMRFNRALGVLRRCNAGLTMDNVSGGAGGGGMTASSTNTLTNKTYDTSATGNVLKQTKYLYFDRPRLKITAWDNTTSRWAGQFKYPNAAVKGDECVEYVAVVPDDIDTSVDLAAKFKFILSGADTGSHLYYIYSSNTADSSDVAGTLSNEVAFASKTDASGAQYDVETTPSATTWTTMTGWKSTLTAGYNWAISVCRDGANDTSTVDSYSHSLVIRYGSVQ